MTWDVHKADALRQLWADGHSSSEIGRRLGLSRGQVLGKIHRMKLHDRLPQMSHHVSRKRAPVDDVLRDGDYSLPDFIIRSVY